MPNEVEKNRIDFDGAFSHAYDEISKKIIPAYDALYELTRHLLREKIGDRAKILVAGAGTGKELIDYSRTNTNWLITGFDPSEKMLSIAKRKITAASLQNKISLVPGLIDDVAETAFDAATAILVMHFLPDDGSKLRFLQGMATRVKQGATIAIVDIEGEPGSNAYQTLNNAWKNQQLSARNDPERVFEEFQTREKEVHCIAPTRMESLLKEAGFFDIILYFKAYLFGGYLATKA